MKNVQLDQIYEGVDYSGINIEFQALMKISHYVYLVYLIMILVKI